MRACAVFSALLLGCAVVWSNGLSTATAQEGAAEITSSAEAESLESGPTDVEGGDSHSTESGSGTDEHGDDAHAADEAHADSHHDPFDLGHQNAAPGLEDPSEFRSDLAIWTFVVFMCLLLLLAKFAWGPIVVGLDKREQSIAGKIEEAQKSAYLAAQQLAQYEARLAAAGDEARQVVADARRDAEQAADRIRAEAQQDSERERQRAVEDIAHAKNAALQEMTERSADLATLMASRMLQRQLNPEDHSQLIREALEQLPNPN